MSDEIKVKQILSALDKLSKEVVDKTSELYVYKRGIAESMLNIELKYGHIVKPNSDAKIAFHAAENDINKLCSLRDHLDFEIKEAQKFLEKATKLESHYRNVSKKIGHAMQADGEIELQGVLDSMIAVKFTSEKVH